LIFASTKSGFSTSPLTSSRGFFPKFRLHLRCEGHSKLNLHAAVSSCVTISSCVSMSYCVGMSVYGASRLVWVISSCVTMPHCVGMSVYGASPWVGTPTSRCMLVNRKIYTWCESASENSNQNHTSREGRALSVEAHRAVAGVPCLREMGRTA